MTGFWLWFLLNDYGYINEIRVLFVMLIALMAFIINLSCLKKGIIQAIVSLTIIIFVGLTAYMLRSVTVVDIPQYGTQSQKEMLAICIQDKRPNGLTEEDKENIAITINNIMKVCKEDYDQLEAKHKRELEHKKFLLKNKEILDSLDKVLIEQGAK